MLSIYILVTTFLVVGFNSSPIKYFDIEEEFHKCTKEVHKDDDVIPSPSYDIKRPCIEMCAYKGVTLSDPLLIASREKELRNENITLSVAEAYDVQIAKCIKDPKAFHNPGIW